MQADEDSNDVGNNAKLVLESIVVPEGPNLENLPLESQKYLNSAACKTFFLWFCPLEWYGQCAKTGLHTTPGISQPDDSIFPGPSDHVVRYYLQWVMEMARRGGYTSGDCFLV